MHFDRHMKVSFAGALLAAQVAALVAREGAPRGCLRVGALAAVFVARVALDDREPAALVVDVEGEGGVADLDVVREAAEVLLLVVLANGELIVDEVVALDSD